MRGTPGSPPGPAHPSLGLVAPVHGSQLGTPSLRPRHSLQLGKPLRTRRQGPAPPPRSPAAAAVCPAGLSRPPPAAPCGSQTRGTQEGRAPRPGDPAARRREGAGRGEAAAGLKQPRRFRFQSKWDKPKGAPRTPQSSPPAAGLRPRAASCRLTCGCPTGSAGAGRQARRHRGSKRPRGAGGEAGARFPAPHPARRPRPRGRRGPAGGGALEVLSGRAGPWRC